MIDPPIWWLTHTSMKNSSQEFSFSIVNWICGNYPVSSSRLIMMLVSSMYLAQTSGDGPLMPFSLASGVFILCGHLRKFSHRKSLVSLVWGTLDWMRTILLCQIMVFPVARQWGLVVCTVCGLHHSWSKVPSLFPVSSIYFAENFLAMFLCTTINSPISPEDSAVSLYAHIVPRSVRGPPTLMPYEDIIRVVYCDNVRMYDFNRHFVFSPFFRALSDVRYFATHISVSKWWHARCSTADVEHPSFVILLKIWNAEVCADTIQ